MECITCFLQVVVSIVLPLWAYIWFRERIRKRFTRNNEDTLDLILTLKRWWARWCITKRTPDEDKIYKKHLINTAGIVCLKRHLEDHNVLTDEKSCNSVSFYAADQKGNTIFVKLAHRRHKITEVFLQLTLLDGRNYVLPECPDSVVVDNLSQGWSALGLRIELLEPQKRWRITYNGMLKNALQPNSEEHIRLNCIFIANSRPFEWPNSWSPYLHAEALAHEPWRSPDWINTIKKVDYSGFDQWGSIIGQLTFADGTTNELYLRGLSQRRWGKHESAEFHKSVTFLGITSKGAMYYLGASSTKNGFSHMQFGLIKKSSEAVCKIDATSLRLNDFWKSKSDVEHRVHFTALATGDEFDAVMRSESTTVFYSGQPWNWTTELRNLKLELNGDKGVGLMQVWYPYTESHRDHVKVMNTKIQFALQPNTCIQKDDHVLFFDDKKCLNENIVGGKGFSLAVLSSVKNPDFIIPKGCCITIFALDLQLQSHKKLQEAIDHVEKISTGKGKGDLRTSCEQAMKLIEDISPIEVVKEAIANAVKELEATKDEDGTVNKYAIRSSAVGEDSEETSAAGQNATFLGVKANDVIQHVVKCWASLYTFQSVQYRRQNGLPIKASMGVCIQKMVNADAAGVMFTRHPTSGDPTSIIITANYGLGETVVSGAVEPDTITVTRRNDTVLSIKSKELGKKTEKMSMNNDGVATIRLDSKDIEKACITDEIIIKLAELGIQLESLFGSPRDIEWAVAKNKIYLLQARPITSFNIWTNFELTHELDSGVLPDTDLITLANVGEVLPKPVSPLSASTVYRMIDVSVALKYDELDSYYVLLTALKSNLNYYGIFLRWVNKEISLAEKMTDIAISGKVIVTPEMYKNAQEKYGLLNWKKQYSLLFEMVYELWYNSSLLKKVQKLHDNLKFDLDKFHTAYSLHNEISAKYKDLLEISIDHSQTSRVSITYQMLAMSMLTKGYSDLIPDHFADIALLLSSCSDIVSKEVPVRLREIVRHIRSSGKAEEFVQIDPVDGINWLNSNCPEAAKLLDNLLKEHGHRGIQELDFVSEPWGMKPETLLATLQALATSPQNNEATKQLSVEETVAALKTPKSWFMKWLLKKIVPFCRHGVASREFTKSMLASSAHKIRLAYKKLASLMVMEGHLPDENLIFYLTHCEIEQMLTNKNHNPTLVRKALRRSKLIKQLEKIRYPDFCNSILTPIENEVDDMDKDRTRVEGTSVYGGSVLARACVIRDLSEAKSIKQGDILITYGTDIGWSPYFPLLSGIVTEIGGLISHGAVIAREYGLPCIISARGATTIFQTGDDVLLVADRGVLELVQRH